MYEVIAQLQNALSKPLPGRAAQLRMAHMGRKLYVEPPAHARKAGVLALLYPRAAQWHIALMLRVSGNAQDRHSGQVSFPGGSFDPLQDHSLLDTALRETEEEIGVSRQAVQVMGALTDLYIPVSNFHVHPFVGFVSDTPPMTPQSDEVQHILEAPLPWLQNPAARQHADIVLGKDLVLPQVPCFMIQDHVVWGATAMMLSELLALLE